MSKGGRGMLGYICAVAIAGGGSGRQREGQCASKSIHNITSQLGLIGE